MVAASVTRIFFHGVILKKHLIAIALCGFGVAQATTLYNFSYDASFGTISGQILGTLQGDNNTIVVGSVVDFAKFNGTPGPSLQSIRSISNVVLHSGLPATGQCQP